MEAIAGKQTALDGGETEFCLTLAAPSISESMKSRAERSRSVAGSLGGTAGGFEAGSVDHRHRTDRRQSISGQHFDRARRRRRPSAARRSSGVSSIAPPPLHLPVTTPFLTADATAGMGRSHSAETADAGEGKVIAVIDTGIDPGHEAMALDDPSAVKSATKAGRARPLPNWATAAITAKRFLFILTMPTAISTYSMKTMSSMACMWPASARAIPIRCRSCAAGPDSRHAGVWGGIQ